jgi:cyclophilin family peptidyl-prolyl cis-trans isomerase/HEAT repeat protein
MVNLASGGVRRRAILALGRIGSPAAVTRLVDRLSLDLNPEMRALAAFALGEIESHYAAPDLLARLDPTTETSAEVRARAVEALGKIASNKNSAEALGKFGVGSIRDAIVHQLPDPSQPPSDDARRIASMALTALLRIKQSSTVEAIAAQLRSPSPDLRWQAANALARIREGIAWAAPALLPLLADKDPLVRAHVARAISLTGDKRALDPVIGLLGDSDERVIASAINALGVMGDPRAVDPLTSLGARLLAGYRAFDREKEGVPTQQNLLLLIASSLGSIKDPRGLAFLKPFRAAHARIGSSPEVEIAIAKMGEAAFFDVPETLKLARDDWRAVAAYAQGLGELGGERAKKLLLDLLSGQPDHRAVSDILKAMKQAKVEGLNAILTGQLKVQDVVVRATAATLLGELQDDSDGVITALGEAFKTARADKANDARLAILDAADKLKHPMNIQALSDPTRDEDYIVRRHALELLRQPNQEALSIKLTVGKVETGHDKAYWRRMGQLAESSKKPTAIIHTRKGDIRIELFNSDAPMTVDNFIQLSKRGFYDGLSFMRVVPNFVIQGGDPRNDMEGGPGHQIRCEINQRPYLAGTVGMALSGKDTGGSQFFITHSPQPHLDGGYTVFGQVVAGMEVLNRIARGDRIEKVEIVEPK